MHHVLFVCTGNIFRSMIAEHALRAHLGPASDITVSSAGLIAGPQEIRKEVRNYLLARGIDPSSHIQRRVTKEILAQADLVIAMGLNHRDYLYDHFNCNAVLFNEVCFGELTPVLDVDEVIPDWQQRTEEAAVYAKSVADHICNAIPALVQSLSAKFR